MPAIPYKEPSTKIPYTLICSKTEAEDIASTAPTAAVVIKMPDTGGTVEFDGAGSVTITTKNGQHSFASANELVKNAKAALK
ncbi:hypothetical protein [Luteimonas sp. MC1750]|uniref:hypothetical protein n=1 Tax=Luteimonas sp. MC1750 TaxID=2799326 RepID=UPI0018F08AA2|nr:hypothetical protein [Luteimonas sp. MC1750]MBJ6985756.1 hypothetical protein [Luteimonas sp. MC1750]QQO05923.1 hypothetical protein JGR68_00200 [Luteimonas sp. MC1750]